MNLITLNARLDEFRRYSREARRQRFIHDVDQRSDHRCAAKGRAAHYAFKAQAALAMVQLEVGMLANDRRKGR